MKKTRRYISFVLMVCFMFSIIGPASAAVNENDIQGHWAQETIEKWVNNGWILGYSDGSFKPDNQITKAEFTALVNRVLDETSESAACSFSDVEESDWFYQDIAVAKTSGYVSGYPDGTFRPKQNISRQEAAAIITKILNTASDGNDYAAAFADADKIAAWSRDNINIVVANKIMNGYPDGSFKAENYISRAEAVITLDRLLVRLDSEAPLTVPPEEEVTAPAPSQEQNEEEYNHHSYAASDVDSDGDGLSDADEEIWRTNLISNDTDGDGLYDSFETMWYSEYLINPTLNDADNNGISDCDEDYDSDGLCNLLEQKFETDPYISDTDNDGLTDKEEIESYLTNPNNPDTDEDGLSDYMECKLGTNPLIADSDGNGTRDGDETYTYQFDNLYYGLQLEVTAEGSVLNTINVSSPDERLMEPYSLIGQPVDISAEGSILEAKVTLSYENCDLGGTPPEDIGLFWFDEEHGTFVPLENQGVDTVNKTVYGYTTHFSIYTMLNKVLWSLTWGNNLTEGRQNTEQEKFIDLAFVIDSSGSMTSNDPSMWRVQGAKSVVDSLLPGDRAMVIDFDSYAAVLQGLTDDKERLKAALDVIDSSGGTNIEKAVTLAIDKFVEWSVNRERVAILLTDGQGTYNSAVTSRAIAENVKIFTIGLGSSVDTVLLTDIATQTGGKYYAAGTDLDLAAIYLDIARMIDAAVDTDGDGLPNWVEEQKGYLKGAPGIEVGPTDPYNKHSDATATDSDGDGLTDGEETGTYYYDNDGKVYYSTEGVKPYKSDPLKMDTDGDGINDKDDTEPRIFNKETSNIDKFIAIAEEEYDKGFKETYDPKKGEGDNITIYGEWAGVNGQPWCAAFVSWCANKAGILGTTVPKYTACTAGKNWYIDKGNFKSKTSGYDPKAGDVIFFTKNKGATDYHTGIIIGYDSKTQTIYTIEGNSSDSIAKRQYSLLYGYLDGFGVNGGTDFGQISWNATSGANQRTR